MKRIAILAAGAPVTVALALAVPALASSQASSPKVSVRVEGVSKTLLAAKSVRAPSKGSITTGGAPKGACPADSAAGALDAATGGRWGGKYDNGLGIEVTKVLGETDVFAKGHWWELFDNDRPTTVGICSLKVKSGDKLLLAAVASKGAAEHPIVLKVPATAVLGERIHVKAFYFPGRSDKTKPLAGVKLAGLHAKTNAKGIATVVVLKAPKLSLVGSKPGEIRSAATTVTVPIAK